MKKGSLLLLCVAHVWATHGYRFHVLGPSHLPVSSHYDACAFTQKIVKLCRMLLAYNHTVFLYGAEGTDATLATEWVQTHTINDIRRDFGDDGYTGPHAIGYEWQGTGTGFRHDFQTHVPSTRTFYTNAIVEIKKRMQKDDFMLATLGTHHKPITDAVGLELTAEPGIGYRGSFARFRAFESNYIRYFTYGSQSPGKGLDGDFYHRTIPNYYELSDFPYSSIPSMNRGSAPHAGTGYYLFLARIIRRKGLWIAIEVCRRMNLRLIIAGQGHQGWFPENRTLFDQSGNSYILTDRMEFVGYANAIMRSALMRGAIAVFTPTLFLEPFCGVAVEAQLSGTPVITTSFGAFSETVEHGQTGVRCHTLSDFMKATALVPHFDRAYIRKRAVRLYSTESVATQYEKWWEDMYHVYESIESNGTLRGWGRMPEWYTAPTELRGGDDTQKDEL